MILRALGFLVLLAIVAAIACAVFEKYIHEDPYDD